MCDCLVRAIAADGQIRVSSVVTTGLVEHARKRHDTFPVATAALGRAMTGALLLSWGLKDEGTITLRFFGDGPLGGMIVNANAEGQVRGYVNEPHVDLPLNSIGKLDVGGAVGEGFLYFTKDIGLREPYTGSVPLVSGEIGEDIATYLVQSEQTPSLVSLGVLVDPDLSVAASGGIIIQALPNAPEDLLMKIEENLSDIPPISTLIKEGYTANDLISKYLPGIDVKILEETSVGFSCKCSRERIAGLMKTVGEEEIKDILANEGKSELICHFCNEKYVFTKEDLEGFLVEISAEKESK